MFLKVNPVEFDNLIKSICYTISVIGFSVQEWNGEPSTPTEPHISHYLSL